MRFYAPLKPEIREQDIEHAEKIGYARTAGHERVHVGRAVFQLLPRIDVEASPQPEYDRGGEYPHYNIRIRHIHEEHACDEDRKGKDYGPDRPAPEVRIPFPPVVFRVIGRLVLAVDDEIVAGIPYGFLQRFRAALPGLVFHVRRAGREVYRGMQHSRLAVQCFLYPRRASCAAHSGYRKISCLVLAHDKFA